MAKLSCSGLADLEEVFSKAGDIPDDVVTNMLRSMGDEVQAAVKKSAANHNVPSGPMLASLTNKAPRLTPNGGTITTIFKGGRTRGKTYTREAEIAFITNYGKRGEPARPFITSVTENPDDSIAAAGEKVLNAYLEKVGL